MKNRLYCLTVTAVWKEEQKFIVFCSFRHWREKERWIRRFRKLLYELNLKWRLEPCAIRATVEEFERSGSFDVTGCNSVIHEIESWVMATTFSL